MRIAIHIEAESILKPKSAVSEFCFNLSIVKFFKKSDTADFVLKLHFKVHSACHLTDFLEGYI